MLPYPARADNLPTLRKGMWEFSRLVQDPSTPGPPMNVTNSKKCTDPTADMKKMNELLARQGCTFSAVVKNGNIYTFTSDCPLQGKVVNSRTFITVQSDSVYGVDVTSTIDERFAKRESLRAKRIGDC
jgi:hypothetical protein